jgi:hypothetical protein
MKFLPPRFCRSCRILGLTQSMYVLLFFTLAFLLPVCIGYVKQFRSLRDFLSQQPFYDNIEMIPMEDRGVTGNFEITIGNQLVHSKRTAGQGRCTNSKERAMLLEFIQEYLDDNL